MAKYKCLLCGEIIDEADGYNFAELQFCPFCGAGKNQLVPYVEDEEKK